MRESAISLNFPALDEVVGRWRLATVEVAALGAPPHVTLLYSWRSPPVGEADVEAARAAVAGRERFTVQFDGIGHFPGVIYLTVADEAPVLALTEALVAAFPECPRYHGLFDPLPHLTIARAPDDAALAALLIEIERDLGPRLPLHAPVTEVGVMEQADSGHWQPRATLPLEA